MKRCINCKFRSGYVCILTGNYIHYSGLWANKCIHWSPNELEQKQRIINRAIEILQSDNEEAKEEIIKAVKKWEKQHM